MSDIESKFDRETMNTVCTMREREFGAAYDMRVFKSPQHRAPENFYFFKDHGSRVLAVAHLDTVADASERECHFIETSGGEVVFSRALDDRLGAYIILEWLPALGIQYDILLTVGEESGQSTAEAFDHPDGKEYDWIIEFDRGGTDVVMYQYDDADTREAVRRCGAKVGDGIFSDISYMEHLGAKAFNWGVGYRDYHGPRSHAYLDDTYMMLGYFLTFHAQNYGLSMPHDLDSKDDEYADTWSWDRGWSSARRSGSTFSSLWGDREDMERWDDDDVDPTEEELWSQPDALDDDWIETPTLEQMQAFEEAEAKREEARKERLS